jgi:ESX secretion system protein EccD
MQDGRTRVTVVGTRRRAHVAVPSDAPIGEFVSGLADMCRQERRRVLPQAWSLALAGRPAMQLGDSLADRGVVDGQVLYLRDLARDPDAAPIVEDIDEIVSTEVDRLRHDAAPRGLLAVWFGLVWLVGVAAVTGFLHGGSVVGVAGCLVVVGLIMLTIAWGVEQRRVRLPAPLSLAMSLSALPCMTVAGGLLGEVLGGPPFLWIGGLVGANLACLLALAARPGPLIFAIELQLAAAAVIAVVLVLVRATQAQVAASAVISGLAMIGLSKTVAAGLAAWSGRTSGAGATPAEVATEMLTRARHILAVALVGPTVALLVGFPVLALAGSVVSFVLACVGSVAVVVRAYQAAFTGEAVLIGGAGAAGLFAICLRLAELLTGMGTMGGMTLALIGLCLVGGGVAVVALGHAPVRAPADRGSGSGGPPDRRKYVDTLGMLCVIASASLAMGVFGVFGDLVTMGRGIIG